MYEFLTKHVLAPVLDICRGTETMKCLKELEETQWWPRHKILALQNERLSKLIRYAYDNVPYYHRIFQEKGLKPEDMETSEDLVKLPILTKQLIRNNFSDFVAQDFPKRQLMLRSTGGSTGEPLEFLRTKHDFYNWGSAAELRAYGWAGYELGKKCALLWETYPYKSTIEKFTRTLTSLLERIVVFNALEISVDKLPLLANRLVSFQGGFIRGYPTAIYLLARFIEREGKSKIRPKAIITSGEQLYDFQRELYFKVFKCEAYSHYGSNEAHAIASECSEHSGYHISAENVIIEIVNDEGRPVPVGEEGRILVTNLHNYAMTFIRYETGDVGVISDKACPCGRGLPLLAAVNGRTADVISTKSGGRIPGVALPWGFLASLGVEQFQIVQENYEKVVIKLIIDKEYPRDRVDEIIKEVLRRFRSMFGDDIDVAAELVDQILPTRSGKTRFVISNLPERF